SAEATANPDVKSLVYSIRNYFFFFQAEDGIRDRTVTGVQTCALPISPDRRAAAALPAPGAGRQAEGHRRRVRRVRHQGDVVSPGVVRAAGPPVAAAATLRARSPTPGI